MLATAIYVALGEKTFPKRPIDSDGDVDFEYLPTSMLADISARREDMSDYVSEDSPLEEEDSNGDGMTLMDPHPESRKCTEQKESSPMPDLESDLLKYSDGKVFFRIDFSSG